MVTLLALLANKLPPASHYIPANSSDLVSELVTVPFDGLSPVADVAMAPLDRG